MTRERNDATPLLETRTQVFERARLLIDLEEATDPASADGTLLVLGFRRRRDRPASAMTRNDIALLDRLSDLVGSLGPVYRTRCTEVCALLDLGDDEVDRLVQELRRILVEEKRRATVGIGVVMLPEEALDPVTALAAADTRLLGDTTARRLPHGSLHLSTSRGLTLLQWQ